MSAEDKVKKIGGSADQDEKQRGRSTIEFPYLDLDDAIEITEAVHKIGGSSCEWDQLAASLKQAAQGGGFRLRMITAKLFGLLTYDRGTVALTPLGMRMADASQAKKAKAEAFLTVPLYRAVYDKFRGVSLPPPAGLEREMEALGVAPKQKDKARQVFQRSAKSAGFFEFGNDRLVMPSGVSAQLAPATHRDSAPPSTPAANFGSSDNGGGGGFHPFIQGLLKSLPKPETDWSIDQRMRWLQTAAGIFDLMYTGNTEGRRINVKEASEG